MRLQLSIRSLLFASFLAALSISLLSRLWSTYITPRRTSATLREAGVEAYVDNFFSTERSLETFHFRHLEPTSGCTGLRIKKASSQGILIAASRVKTADSLVILQLAKGVSPEGCNYQHLTDLYLGDANNQQVRQWIDAAPHLSHLNITASEDLTPETFAWISKIRWLKSLQLNKTSLSADHIKALGDLPAFRFLGLENCNFTPNAIDQLRGFPTLHSLRLYGPTYDDRSLKKLENATQITSLDLSYTSITNQGIEELPSWTHLRSLDLYGCAKISPKCVPDLIEMRFLDSIDVLRTAVEDNKALRNQMGDKLQEWIL